MSLTATLTGATGPGWALAAAVYSGISDFTIHSNTNVLEFTKEGVVSFVSVPAATTVTATKSGNTWTVTVS